MYRPDYIKNTTSLMPSWVKEENTTRKYVSLYHPNFNILYSHIKPNTDNRIGIGRIKGIIQIP